MEVLASKTGISLERIEQTTLIGYEGRICERINLKGHSRWILPLGMNPHTAECWGQQFCALCLSEGPTYYYRREWRLAFITSCARHRLQLLDRCSCCGTAIQYRELSARNHGYAFRVSNRCHNCGKPLNYQSKACSLREIQFEASLLQIAEQGWTNISGVGPIYSHLFFTVLRRLMILLTIGPQGAKLRKHLTEKCRTSDLQVGRKAFATLELLDVNTRRALLAMTRELMADWPEHFIECCKASGISKQFLFNHMRYIPYWFWKVVSEKLTVARYEATEQEIEAAVSYIYRQYDIYGNARYFPPHVRAVGVFLNNVTSRRKVKLWKKLRIPNRRLKANRSSETRFNESAEQSPLPEPQLIPDHIWDQVRDLLPNGQPYRYGTPDGGVVDNRTVLSGIVYVLGTRCTWDCVPSQFGSREQVYSKYKKWRRVEAFPRILALCLQRNSTGG